MKTPSCSRREFLRATAVTSLAALAEPLSTFAANEPACQLGCYTRPWDAFVVGMSVKDFKAPKEVMVTPGTGQVNFAKVFANLKQGGFTRGPLVVECLTRGDTPARITAETKQARRLVEELVR